MSRESERTIAGLRTITVAAPGDARAIVVLLHGFAMTPSDLSPFAHSLAVPAEFLFPEGPVEAALVPGVPCGRAWWHIDPAMRAAAIAHGPRDFAELHPPDLAAARAQLGAFLDEVIAGADGRPVVLGGFSSGGMLAWDTQLRSPRPIAGLALLSATRIAWSEEASLLSEATLRGLPMLLSHGLADADLAFAAGEALRDAAIAAGAQVTWVPFDRGHEIPLVVWRRLRAFVLDRAR